MEFLPEASPEDGLPETAIGIGIGGRGRRREESGSGLCVDEDM